MLKVLEVALGEVGYVEGNGNVTKYAAYLDSMTDFYNGAKNGYAWCDVFVDWCFVAAYGRELAQKLLCQPNGSAGAGCTYSAMYYQRQGRFSKTPQVGAQIFFGNQAESTHTGLVYDLDDTTVYTVEGNSADGVYERQYSRGDESIYGYGMPDYSLVAKEGEIQVAAPETEKTGETESGGADEYGGYPTDERDEYLEFCSVDLPKLRLGSVSNSVAAMQTLLIRKGYSVGIDGADGDFGVNTLAAVKSFQSDRQMATDGAVGKDTWAALFAG